MRNHRRLLIWQRSHALAIEVRRATRQFPRTGYGSLQTQIHRAAESVIFTIVEGCGTDSEKEFARFIDMAIRSTSELEAQLELARDYGVMARRSWERLSNENVEVRRMLCGLRAKIRESLGKDQPPERPEKRSDRSSEAEEQDGSSEAPPDDRPHES